jgi:hypothetical protein
VELDMTEMDITSAETEATYQEIKDYIYEKHGVKVSSLYISQVKRQCGLDVGESYNKPKLVNTNQPQCPEVKVELIRDALAHYQMI